MWTAGVMQWLVQWASSWKVVGLRPIGGKDLWGSNPELSVLWPQWEDSRPHSTSIIHFPDAIWEWLKLLNQDGMCLYLLGLVDAIWKGCGSTTLSQRFQPCWNSMSSISLISILKVFKNSTTQLGSLKLCWNSVSSSSFSLIIKKKKVSNSVAPVALVSLWPWFHFLLCFHTHGEFVSKPLESRDPCETVVWGTSWCHFPRVASHSVWLRG